MATVLSLRPQAANPALAARLNDLGHTLIAAPLLKIEHIDTSPPKAASECSAAIITSVNALAALGSMNWSAPVHAVGRETTAAAAQAGLVTVPPPAQGDAPGLAAALSQRMQRGSVLLYPRGETVAFQMARSLAEVGLRCVEWTVYRTVPTSHDDPALKSTRASLAMGKIDAVLLTSPALARAFVTWTQEDGIDKSENGARLLALGPRIANTLPISLRARAEVAVEPNMAALLSLV